MTTRTIERTIDLDYAGQNFREGTIDLEGASVASFEALADLSRGSAAWSTGVVEIRGLAAGSVVPRAFATPQTLTSSAPSRRGGGDGTLGVQADSRIEGVVTTAESGVKLRVIVTLSQQEI